MEREGTNGFNGEELGKYLDQIDDADDELLKLKMEHMAACKKPRGRIKQTMKQAKESGLNMSAFRAIVKKHRSERDVAAELAKLEADDHADFEEMQRALGDFGDTPLGAAALDRAKPATPQHDQDALDRLGRGT